MLGRPEVENLEIDLDKPIRAWRQWLYFSSGKGSLRTRAEWVPGRVLEAECLVAKPDDAAKYILKNFNTLPLWPSVNPINPDDIEPCEVCPCSPDSLTHPFGIFCGIYGWSKPEHMMSVPMWHAGHSHDDVRVVTGTVLLGGRIWPHERGYRAQYGLVESIYDVNIYDYNIAMEYQAFIREPENEHIDTWLEKYRIKSRKLEAGLIAGEEEDG